MCPVLSGSTPRPFWASAWAPEQGLCGLLGPKEIRREAEGEGEVGAFAGDKGLAERGGKEGPLGQSQSIGPTCPPHDSTEKGARAPSGPKKEKGGWGGARVRCV